MATEYYIVKPKTKQKFYLGKRISHLEGIPTWRYTKDERFPEWETWEDVVFDLEQNSRYFLEGRDILVGQVWDFCSAIYDFCDSEVYLDNDCNDFNYPNWADYEEVDILSDIMTTEERWEELINYIPSEKWVTEDHIVYAFETVKKYLQELGQKEGEQK